MAHTVVESNVANRGIAPKKLPDYGMTRGDCEPRDRRYCDKVGGGDGIWQRGHGSARENEADQCGIHRT